MRRKVINCIIVDDESMAREILVTMLKNMSDVNVVGQFSSALEAFQFINDQHVDLIFLDINMPNISGISFAKSIRDRIQIIFTTAYREYAVEGFELQAVDYLLKPISADRLSRALQRYTDLHKPQAPVKASYEEKPEFIFVRSNRKMIQVNFDATFYVESYSDYVKIHTDTQVVITRETISSIESKLPNHLFARIHRSYIVALKHVTSYTSEAVTCRGKELSISRSYRKSVLLRLSIH